MYLVAAMPATWQTMVYGLVIVIDVESIAVALQKILTHNLRDKPYRPTTVDSLKEPIYRPDLIDSACFQSVQQGDPQVPRIR